MSFLHHHLEEGARTQIHLLVTPLGVKTPTLSLATASKLLNIT